MKQITAIALILLISACSKETVKITERPGVKVTKLTKEEYDRKIAEMRRKQADEKGDRAVDKE